jgi:hypothetical protein
MANCLYYYYKKKFFFLAVQHIQHLKNTQMTILAELERLVGENEQLRK